MGYGVPGVLALTKELNSRTMGDTWVKHNKADVALGIIIARLTSLYGNPDEVHFERIYHVANRLMQHARDPAKAAPEFRPVMQPFFADLPPELTENALHVLERAYLRHLFKIIAEKSLAPDVSAIAAFVDDLRRHFAVRIYSLNYDDLFYRACPDLFTGFGGAKSPRRFDRDTFFSMREADALFHLHGSIHVSYTNPGAGEFAELFWFDEVSEAIKSADYSGSGRDQGDGTFIERSPLVTGLEKSASVLSMPHSFYYSEMLRDVMTCDTLFVIGYGLGDPHVNEQLKTARAGPNPPRIVVIDYFDWMEMFGSVSPKARHLIHTLRIPVYESITAVPGPRPGWRQSVSDRAVIWSKGFVDFLKGTPDPADFVRAIA